MENKSCCFFGHSDCREVIKPILLKTLIELIENGVKLFYVGNHGFFDSIVLSALKELKNIYPHIEYYVTLAYLPTNQKYIADNDYETVFPAGIEYVPPKFAIFFRNKWMLSKCNFVVTYITRSHGGAAQFYELALKKNKTVINLPEKI